MLVLCLFSLSLRIAAYSLPKGVAPKDPLHELKTKLLTNLSIPCSPGEFPLSLAPDLDPQLQAFIRITSMEDGWFGGAG